MGTMKKITEVASNEYLGDINFPKDGWMSPFGIHIDYFKDGKKMVRVIPWTSIKYFDYQAQEDNNL